MQKKVTALGNVMKVIIKVEIVVLSVAVIIIIAQVVQDTPCHLVIIQLVERLLQERVSRPVVETIIIVVEV